jgi:general L-amino acid transport system substrate-binding protein
VDILARNTTASMSRDTQLGLDFPSINFYDGPGLHVCARSRVSPSARDLNGASVCTPQGTTPSATSRLLPLHNHDITKTQKR